LSPHSVIVSDREFRELLAKLSDQETYAIDTEFHRERTYYPKLALVQVAWGDELALVDPFAVDFSLFESVLQGPHTAVLHAGDQDLEILQLVCGTVPQKLFDTQIAAGFMGLSSPSLASVHERFLQISLEKGDRLTDWLARPLTDAQLIYAANDVAHLLRLQKVMIDELRQRGRLQWALDECEVSRLRTRGMRDPSQAWRRIKEVRSLKGQARAVAQSVAAWREVRAAEIDVPVRYVLSDIAVCSIAQKPPTSISALGQLRGVDRSVRQDIAEDLLRAVKAGMNAPVPSLDDAAVAPLEKDMRPAVALASAWVSQLARDLEIDPAILATRTDLEQFLRGDPAARLRSGWRSEVAGRAIEMLLAGEAAVAFGGSGELVIEERSRRPYGSES